MRASKLRRFATWVVDFGCIFFLFLAALRLLGPGQVGPAAYRFVLLGATVLYYTSAEVFFRRTIGKLLTGTHIVAADGGPPARSQLAVRTLCRFLPLEPLSLLLSRQRLAWHDKISRTQVIHLA